MTDQEVLDRLNGLSLMDLYDLLRGVGRAIERARNSLIASVTQKKNKHGTIILEHPANGSYVCKPCAYKGRWRMWKMVQGKHGLKQGKMVVHEGSSGADGLENLKIQIALGRY